jgi:hypothetical protein
MALGVVEKVPAAQGEQVALVLAVPATKAVPAAQVRHDVQPMVPPAE